MQSFAGNYLIYRIRFTNKHSIFDNCYTDNKRKQLC